MSALSNLAGRGTDSKYSEMDKLMMAFTLQRDLDLLMRYTTSRDILDVKDEVYKGYSSDPEKAVKTTAITIRKYLKCENVDETTYAEFSKLVQSQLYNTGLAGCDPDLKETLNNDLKVVLSSVPITAADYIRDVNILRDEIGNETSDDNAIGKVAGIIFNGVKQNFLDADIVRLVSSGVAAILKKQLGI